jgi:hypothetical protein
MDRLCDISYIRVRPAGPVNGESQATGADCVDLVQLNKEGGTLNMRLGFEIATGLLHPESRTTIPERGCPHWRLRR